MCTVSVVCTYRELKGLSLTCILDQLQVVANLPVNIKKKMH